MFLEHSLDNHLIGSVSPFSDSRIITLAGAPIPRSRLAQGHRFAHRLVICPVRAPAFAGF